MNKNNNLHKAKKAKNDEFYTQITDIEKELKHYDFKGKSILCNCDDPEQSNFWRYFELNFNKLGLKKLVSTHFEHSKPSYKLEYNGDVPVKTNLRQNGDFRSPEVIELLKQADVVVTNPPFSLFREYVAQLVEYDKKFLIVGNMNAITYKEIFKLIKGNKIWLGTKSNIVMEFKLSQECEKFSRQDSNGAKYGKVPAINWFTNLNHNKRHEFVDLYKTYNEDDYPKYDNYDAINVDKVKEIPLDYVGVMGVPITFMGGYCPEQFEIIGMANDKREIHDAFIQGKQVHLDEKHKKFVGMVLKEGGRLRATYARILIKHKQ